MNTNSEIKPFLEPKAVALIGISRRTGKGSFNVLESLLEYGYKGKFYPVNPNLDEVLGTKVYHSVGEVPDDVDLAVILTPRETAPGILKECAERNVKAVVVVGQGFSDGADEEGRDLQNEVAAIAKQTGVRVLGPNTIGTANAFIDFSLSYVKHDMQRIPVGLVCQSGLFFGQINELKLLGKAIDVGNSCDVDAADCMEYFENDPETRVIALHIEGIRDGKKFLKVARRAAKKKPVVVFKTGVSARAAAAAQSHTGSIIGDDEVWDAVFKQCGMIRARSIDEMSDLVKAFCYLPLIKGRSVCTISFSGGMGIVATDSCEQYGLDLIHLSPETEKRIVGASPGWLRVGNPIDLWPAIMISGRPFGEVFREGLDTVLQDEKVQGVVLIAAAWLDKFTPRLTDSIVEMADAFPEKPIVLCPYEGWLYEDANRYDLEDKLVRAGKALVLPTVDRAARALARMAEYADFCQYSG